MKDLPVRIRMSRLQVLASYRNQAFQIKLIGTHKHMNHLLFLIGFITHIGHDDQSGLRCASLTSYEQAHQNEA